MSFSLNEQDGWRVVGMRKKHKDEHCMSNRKIARMSNIIARAKFDFTSFELNLLLKMICEIDKEDTEFKQCSFSPSRLEKFFGKKINRKIFYNLGDTMGEKEITIFDDNGIARSAKWFKRMEYNKDTGQLEAEFNPLLSSLLLNLKGDYILINMEQFLSMSSKYSKRMFMLVQSSIWKGGAHVPLDDLVDIMCAPDMMSNPLFFKHHILTKASFEINCAVNTAVRFTMDKKHATTLVRWSVAKDETKKAPATTKAHKE